MTYGSTLPRVYTAPVTHGPAGPCGCGCALTRATSLGYAAADFAEQVIGLKLLPWQRWLLIHSMEGRYDDGRFIFRFRVVIVLVARQNGKTTLVELKNLFKLYVMQVPLIIGTAQTLDIAEESWDNAVQIAEGVDELAEDVEQIIRVNGKKALVLANGSRWVVKAANRKGGRGLSADDVNLDELREHQSWEAWAAVSKTTLARPNAQIWAFTNAGDAKSVVLNDLHGKARAAAEREPGFDPDFGLFEWSVPDDVDCTCDRKPKKPHARDCRLQDAELWAMANPSLNYVAGDFGYTSRAVASALSTDPTPVFLTEVLCKRVADLGGALINPATWADLQDRESVLAPEGWMVIGVDVSPDDASATIAVAGRREDGLWHVEVIEHRDGATWAPELVAVICERYLDNILAVVMDVGGPAGSIVNALDFLGVKAQKLDKDDLWVPAGRDAATGKIIVPLYVPTTREVCAASAGFVNSVRDLDVRHRGQTVLDAAVDGVAARKVGDAWAFGRRQSDVDISPLVGVALPRYAHDKLSGKIAPDKTYDVMQSIYWG